MERKKILLVDDEIQLADMVKMRLEANNYDVITASGGIEGLEKAEKDNPDLILLDILMPDMDGYQTLEKLKENSETESIPVIMLTAEGQADDLTRSVSLGAIDYVVKPFSPVTLLEKIKTALQLTDNR